MSTFRNALVFFDQLGVYDVVLPFLLIFTMVFAMLEKTLVFGKENGVPRRNLNSMVAFCSAFLVVASSQLVAVINQTIAKSMVLMVASILFMILVGTFSKDEALHLDGAWKKTFMIIMFAGVMLILLYNLGWLEFIWSYAAYNIEGPVVGSFGLLLIVLGFMFYIIKDPKPDGGKDKGGSSGAHH